MKTKKRVGIITAILALVTTGLVYVYLNQATAASKANQTEMENVVVAISEIPAHVKVTTEMLELKEIPIDAAHQDAFTSIDAVVGGTTTTVLIAGEQVLSDRIVLDAKDSPLAYRIPENMRAITVPTSEIGSIGGYIVAGDKLDILVSYTPADGKQVVLTQFQNIEILEKGPYSAVAEERQTGVPTSLTLLVTPAQAEVMAYATLTGTFHFTLRNPVDTVKQDVPSYGADNFESWKER